MPKKCTNPTCDSNGELLDDEMFHTRSDRRTLVGDCRRCVSIKGKAYRKKEIEKKSTARRKTDKQEETDLYNLMNRRW